MAQPPPSARPAMPAMAMKTPYTMAKIPTSQMMLARLSPGLARNRPPRTIISSPVRMDNAM